MVANAIAWVLILLFSSFAVGFLWTAFAEPEEYGALGILGTIVFLCFAWLVAKGAGL